MFVQSTNTNGNTKIKWPKRRKEKRDCNNSGTACITDAGLFSPGIWLWFFPSCRHVVPCLSIALFSVPLASARNLLLSFCVLKAKSSIWRSCLYPSYSQGVYPESVMQDPKKLSSFWKSQNTCVRSTSSPVNFRCVTVLCWNTASSPSSQTPVAMGQLFIFKITFNWYGSNFQHKHTENKPLWAEV